MSLSLINIHHYTVSVGDLDHSAEWYRNILGFENRSRSAGSSQGKSAWLQNGTISLQLVEVTKPNPLPSYRSHPATDNAVQGHKHFSLRVVDGPQTEKELRGLGTNIVFVPIVGETYGIFICDPTGNLIEILQEIRPSHPTKQAPSTGRRPISIQGWSHIAISVPDTEAAVEWYSRVLGLPMAHSDSITSPDGHAFKITWLEGPGFSLEIFEVPGSTRIPEERLDPATYIKTPGNKYLSLGVKDMDKARGELNGLGIEIIPAPGEQACCFIRDNSGNLIEFCTAQD